MANSAITGQVSSLTGGPYVVATSGYISIKPDEVEQVRVTTTSGAVNYWQFSGNATGFEPYCDALGSDTDVGMIWRTKGAGTFDVQTNTTTLQFRVAHTASAVNYLQVTGAATGNPPTLATAGTDTNINAQYTCQGSGKHKFYGGNAGQESIEAINEDTSTPYGIRINFSSGSPDNNTNWFIRAQDSTTLRAVCYSDGDWYNHDNTYGAISDPRVKRNVTPVNSQWNDVKQIASGMINYETKWKPGKRMLGVDADVVEQISPGVVHMVRWGDEDLKAVDTMTMLQKGFKALGEALERIEALEAKAK